MSAFPIYQDAEKENPKQKKIQKVVAGGGKSNVAFTQRNSNAPRNAGKEKLAFREVKPSNTVKDENAGFAATNSTAAVAGKKATSLPVVEQYKTFSVYEDHCIIDQHVSSSTASVENDENLDSEVDKENTYVAERVPLKSISIHKEFGTHDDYILDTTPMSVSEVLSPMSVDRSNILQQSLLHITDDSNTSKTAEEDEETASDARQLRTDRDRFFDVIEYQNDILKYFRESELKHRPKPHYMTRQSDINYSMRTILVDWLVEVSEEYNLDTETLYLAVSYIDRFLSHMSVVRSKLQLVGTAAIYIASKYEEIYPPEVNEFVFITDDTYTKSQVLRMEQIILKILAFDLCTPTAYVYINTYAVVADIPDKLKYLTQFIAELSLLEADPYLRYTPSLISSASLALARYTLNYELMWSNELEALTSYRLEDMREVIMHLCKTHNAATTSDQKAIQDKYKTDKYMHVASIEAVELTADKLDEIVQALKEMPTKNEDQSSKITTTSNDNVRRMISLMFN